MRRALPLVALLLVQPALAQPALAQPALAQTTLRIGIGADPAVLDPAQSGSFVERVVFAAMCDKLIDVGPDLQFRPELATAWEWAPDGRALTLTLREGARFQDGTPIDAAAVKANLDRYRTARESRRRTELQQVASVETPDARTVRLVLSEPFAPLLSVLADRAGMMLSPAVLPMAERVGENPICSGPFRLTRRVAPVDLPSVERDQRLRLVAGDSIAYQTLSINVGNGPMAQRPLGADPQVREAFERSIDRAIINQVALEGRFAANNQPEAPGTAYHFADLAPPPRDPARARALLREAGHGRVAFTLKVPNQPVESQVAQIIQSMAAEGGFDISIETLESGAMVAATRRGDYEAAIAIWSGRPDPDGNISFWLASNGFLNWGKYANPRVDALFGEARRVTDTARRQALYREAATIWMADRPHLMLYHHRWFWAMRSGVEGFEPSPDGIIRFAGLRVGR